MSRNAVEGIEDGPTKLLLLIRDMRHLRLYDGTLLVSVVEITPLDSSRPTAPQTPPLEHPISIEELESDLNTEAGLKEGRNARLLRAGYLFTLKGEDGKIGLSKISELVKLKADYDARGRVNMILNISNELGFSINNETAILDLGCGQGTCVYWLRRWGFKAFGADIGEDYKWAVTRLMKEGILSKESEIFRLMKMGERIPYKIPFPDGTFDFVFSDQVFEHVRDYAPTISEIFRVLKPGGVSLHIFPSRYRIIEGHNYVPFATIFQGLRYFMFWALLGIRNQYQKGLGFREVAHMNVDTASRTNYLSKGNVRRYFSSVFGDAAFVEDVFVKFNQGIPRWVYRIARVTRTLSLLSLMVSTFGTRVVCVRKKR